MVLNARIQSIESGNGWTDRLPRITLRFTDGNVVNRDVTIPQDPKIFGDYIPKLDDVLVFEYQGLLDVK